MKQIIALLEAENDSVASGLTQLDQFLQTLKPLAQALLAGVHDPALVQFQHSQAKLDCNLSCSLVSAYRYFAANGIIAHLEEANTLLLGLLLLHPPSRRLFGKHANMRLMLSFLDPNCKAYLVLCSVSFVSLFIHILLKSPANMRVFEACHGCELVINHLRLTAGSKHQTLHFKVIEFLIFYFSDERAFEPADAPILSLQEKMAFFKPAFPAIEDLVENLSVLIQSA